jgi:hypothetical protein
MMGAHNKNEKFINNFGFKASRKNTVRSKLRGGGYLNVS